jgi:hypothetical protein
MTQITLTPKTTFFAEGVELWDLRQISIEYGVSKTSARTLATLASFPKPYAIAEGGKAYFSVVAVQNWAENTPNMLMLLRNKAKGRGRPAKAVKPELILAYKQ